MPADHSLQMSFDFYPIRLVVGKSDWEKAGKFEEFKKTIGKIANTFFPGWWRTRSALTDQRHDRLYEALPTGIPR